MAREGLAAVEGIKDGEKCCLGGAEVDMSAILREGGQEVLDSLQALGEAVGDLEQEVLGASLWCLLRDVFEKKQGIVGLGGRQGDLHRDPSVLDVRS